MAKSRKRVSQFTPLETDLARVEKAPSTPQTEAPAFRLAFADDDFMQREEVRGARLQLELMKPELVMQARGIVSTIIMFGGARVPKPGETPSAKSEKIKENLEGLAKYYDIAREFAHRASQESLKHYGQEFVIVTGGGPGVMEAGNLGAEQAGAQSIGLNIVLPHEQAPNAHVTPDLCFNFHYFAIRKMHFLMRAKAIAIFPGGFGTLDELFETLTLIQTGRMAKIPVLLFGAEFWRSLINFEALRDAGTISPKDLDLFEFVEAAEEAWASIERFYGLDG